jgi:hypothetical protein
MSDLFDVNDWLAAKQISSSSMRVSGDSLNPFASPSRSLERVREILCLVDDLAVAELDNVYCTEQTDGSPTPGGENETSKSLHSRAQLSCCLPHLTPVNIKEGKRNGRAEKRFG